MFSEAPGWSVHDWARSDKDNRQLLSPARAQAVIMWRWPARGLSSSDKSSVWTMAQVGCGVLLPNILWHRQGQQLGARARCQLNTGSHATMSFLNNACNMYWKGKLDRESIRSSPRYGLSTPYGLTKEQCWIVPPCFYLQGRPAFGPELVHPGCWILIMVQQ